MQKTRKKWPLFLIFSVIALTIYHILPTLFYYSQPLKELVSEERGHRAIRAIEERVEEVRGGAKEWLASYCRLLNIRPLSLGEGAAGEVIVRLKTEGEGATLRRHLQRAGSLIPFAPAQLRPFPGEGKEVVVERMIPYSVAGQGLFSVGSEEEGRQISIDLSKVAKLEGEALRSSLKAHWNPTHPDLAQAPLVSFEEWERLPVEERAMAFLVGVPSGAKEGELSQELLYVIPSGLEELFEMYQKAPESELAQTFFADVERLSFLLAQKGFQPVRGGKGIFFAKGPFYAPLLEATREAFVVKEGRGVLELGTLEKRLALENRIETAIHEELVQWRDDFRSAEVHLNEAMRYDVAPPTRNLLWDNFLLSWKKILRGDEERAIRWGLDLSGGKSVEIELRDAQNRPVSSEEELKLGIDELYRRVNRLGVSEVSIRQMGGHIVADFPGSQSSSASELIQASSMHFHVVNEAFSPHHPKHGEQVHAFLQELWKEAKVSSAFEAEEVQKIACELLYGEKLDLDAPKPATESAKSLYEQGLRLALPGSVLGREGVDLSLSKVALLRGDGPADWQGLPYPYLFVFAEQALEGAHLKAVQSSYDPEKGNYLAFEVANSALDREGREFSPSGRLAAWTGPFSKEGIAGTDKELDTRGRGWRMAVILNGTVISAPSLESPLQERAMISGHFTPREVQQLASDLKAGSLTFTPHILSEKSVSPELGKADRVQGISATVIALLLVVASMVLYYRYAGWIASIAVFFNLLILWATLQNIGASLSLAGIAGIILTVGMAVDANVLVFERFKEEFALSKNLRSALKAGYERAYSAIIDSNVTTLLAALILLNFDAGPIKGFAITLIIGIASSLFTALFMTRVYFDRWAERAPQKELKMANWISSTEIPFVKQGKKAFLLSLLLIGAGLPLLTYHKETLFGIDFTGGTSIDVTLAQSDLADPVDAAKKALLSHGISPQDLQVRQLEPSHHLRLFFSPKAPLPLSTEERTAFLTTSLPLSEASSLANSWTHVSGQMSGAMQTQALLGLLLSFLSIFLYLAIRFESTFSLAAVLCLLHDVAITLALLGLAHAFGLPVQIDLTTIAAIMTIIGYSLNDTIIIFDRIREEMERDLSTPLPTLVNRAINATLSRTAITSGTTLLVLLALLFLGGSSIFTFAFVMTLGVFFGTLSSWFIASPLLLLFHRKEGART